VKIVLQRQTVQTLREQGLGTSAIISIWKLSTVKKVCSPVDHTGSAVLRNQTVGLGDQPQRLHAQFVVVRQFSHR